MRVAYVNIIDNLVAADFTVVGTATGYAITNVQEQRLSVRYRTLTPTAQSVIMDFGTAQTVTTAAILGHNISSSATASSVVLSGSNDGSTWSSITTITRNANAMLKFFATTTNQYFKFAIDDPLNTDGYIEMGRLWLGTYETISPSSTNDFTVTKNNSDIVTFGKNRQKYATPGETWRTFEMSFPPTGGSALTVITALYDAVGKHDSFLFCNFDSVEYELVLPCYVSITDDIEFSHTTRQRYEYSLTMEENL